MKWIDCAEKQPKEYEDVLCLFSDETCDVDYIDGKQMWYKNFPMQPTHWMPLPKPPKK